MSQHVHFSPQHAAYSHTMTDGTKKLLYNTCQDRLVRVVTTAQQIQCLSLLEFHSTYVFNESFNISRCHYSSGWNSELCHYY